MSCPEIKYWLNEYDDNQFNNKELGEGVKHWDKIRTFAPMAYAHYKPAELKNSKGRLYIEFYYRHPVTERWKRFRKYGLLEKGGGLNQIKDFNERVKMGEVWAAAWNNALRDGWMPTEFKKDLPGFQTVKNWNLFQCLNLWKNAIENKNDRPATVKIYNVIINLFLKKFPKVREPVEQIKAKDVEDFLLALKKSEEWSNTTYNSYLKFVRVFFNFCVDQKYLSESPVKKLKKLSETIKKHKYFTDAEFEKIKKHAPRALFEFGELLYETGLRPAEARLLKWKYLNADSLFVPGKISKNRKDEYVPLSKSFAEKLRSKKGEPNDYIFGGKNPTGENYYGNMFSKLKDLLELDEQNSLYGFKHRRAVDLARQGADPYAIMRLLRHSSLEITMKYLRDLGVMIDRSAVDNYKGF